MPAVFPADPHLCDMGTKWPPDTFCSQFKAGHWRWFNISTQFSSPPPHKIWTK